MKEKILYRNGEKVIEVRSDGGKLLFVKTRAGYEMKCPRTKQICLVEYHQMMKDCLNCFDEKLSVEARDHESSAQLRKEDQGRS